MNKTFTLLYFLKKGKLQSDGTVPIYLRLTIDGKRADISSKRYIDPKKWNAKAQKVDGKSEETRSVNVYLKTLEQQVYDAHRELLDAGKHITAETLKNKLTGVEEKQRLLVQIMEQHNKNLEALIGKGYSRATWVKYTTTSRHVKDFLKWKFNLADISIKDLSFEFASDFEFYLKSQKSIDINTNAKYIKNLKKIVKECVAKGWLEKDPFMSFKLKAKASDRTFLTQHELDLLENKQFTIERLNHIKDIFLFSCYTGLAYIDLANLKSYQISIGIDGEKWIFTSRQKSDEPSHVPLLPTAMAIIEKYAAHPKVLNSGKLLPIPSNQKVNSYLKEIADVCGITKELTFHVARHTFATTVTLTNGVPIESVSKMLGHKKLQTTQIYAKILDKRVSDDMKVLRTKLTKEDGSDHLKAITG
ncbi:site-specific integrase [Chitinophagaceae bacterium LB-8]|uniref:Site-specific integrase n=1 Tax=Paraflavisolibacter caeni TaxID=2982496 RepID=A0A9X2Y2P4_9BACT|nr:site-specific integrase [Paraflavisolibacter caeni]MCU7552858.1 site-specific integrase [Paraflavisolibacter caeni]